MRDAIKQRVRRAYLWVDGSVGVVASETEIWVEEKKAMRGDT